MNDVEPLIVSELERMLPLPSGGRADWTEVLHRAGIAAAAKRRRVSRRTVLALAGAVIVGLAIAVPASGLPQTVINWLSASKAPEQAQKSFQSLDIGAPAGMAPGLSGPARSVMEAKISGKNVNFWVAPTASGGFCLELQDYGGGCDRNRQLPISWTLAERTTKTPVILSGDALSTQVDHMELRFADGRTVSIPVVTVSDPINASFFIYEVPGDGPQAGDWPATLQAVDSDGKVIASDTFSYGAPPIPPNH